MIMREKMLSVNWILELAAFRLNNEEAEIVIDIN